MPGIVLVVDLILYCSVVNSNSTEESLSVRIIEGASTCLNIVKDFLPDLDISSELIENILI